MYLLGRRQIDLLIGAVAVRCHDVAGRSRHVLISRMADEQVALTIPPGEVATLSGLQVDDLRDELRAAAFNAAGALVGERGEFPPAPNLRRVEIPCTDAVGRHRDIVVLSGVDNPVTLIAPAGGLAVLWSYQIGNLRYRLKNAKLNVMQAASSAVVGERIST
ncbi:hypothetical protein [Lentzea terrae]|uniref:hypothetical protein n=1 Tax=Lentzea terrae TaxID=2200761 RepID=UPI000DD2CEAA|nr:hypothetical protein [Lentzea terrae]